MKKTLLLFCIIILFQFLIGCSSKKDVGFKEFYSEVVGFQDNDEKLKTVPQDTILMMTNEDFQKFTDEYFTPRELPIESPDKKKAVLYIQISSPTSSVNTYRVKSITIRNKTLIVSLEKSAVVKVDAKSGFNGTWKWVMFIEANKAKLKDDMKIVVKK